jgi:hypothetical protein
VWRSSLRSDGAHVLENRLRRTAVVPAPLGRGGTPDVRPAERHHHHLLLGQDHHPATTTRQLQTRYFLLPDTDSGSDKLLRCIAQNRCRGRQIPGRSGQPFILVGVFENQRERSLNLRDCPGWPRRLPPRASLLGRDRSQGGSGGPNGIRSSAVTRLGSHPSQRMGAPVARHCHRESEWLSSPTARDVEWVGSGSTGTV